MNKPAILGIGTATPPGPLPQARIAEHAGDVAAARSDPAGVRDPRRTVRALYRRAGVESRGSVLNAEAGLEAFFPTLQSADPTTAQRLAAYREHAGSLARAAAHAALTTAGTTPDAITHIVTASCTGFDAPGVDQHLIHTLGLSPAVRRTNVGFMGCHAAINALAAASAFASVDPTARVLVCCVELCSLHFSYDADPERHVANALFADGAAAAVVGQPAQGGRHLYPSIAGFASTLIPDTASLMNWTIGDHGFEMRLSPKVPDRLAAFVPAWIKSFLESENMSPGDIADWAIHPGGPRVLSSLTKALSLPPGSDAASRAVLAEHGNMSSATALFIIDRLLRSRPAGRARSPLVTMAFGPGLAGEAMLLGYPDLRSAGERPPTTDA